MGDDCYFVVDSLLNVHAFSIRATTRAVYFEYVIVFQGSTLKYRKAVHCSNPSVL